jgi:hypothetical protein
MKTLPVLIHGCLVVGVAVAAMTSIGCATRERVVVREHPAYVQERVVVTQPVVQERVIVRP